MTGDEAARDRDGLVEVAVALPVSGTFTYRDPRRGMTMPPGTQVVVPFGGRTVTGFVLGPGVLPEGAGAVKPREIEAVVSGEPAFDEEMLGLCRWAADYYQAPLGEMLRAGLPQGERASSVRGARITPDGEAVLRGERPLWLHPSEITRGGSSSSAQVPLVGLATTSAVDPDRERARPLLQAIADARGGLALRVIEKRFPRTQSQVQKLEAAGLIEIGDEVRERRAEAFETFVLQASPSPDVLQAALSPRARGRHAVMARIAEASAGIALSTFSVAERAHVRVLARLGVLTLEKRAQASLPTRAPTAGSEAPRPTSAQDAAIREIQASLTHGYSTFLLRGVTGSGKTEVYLRAIASAREAGRGALVLVPEIALTPQLASRFRARFGDDVAVLHSALPSRERLAAWRRLRSGEVGIALGARSAVFAPVRNLGIVVVDEEHDSSFKQEEGVRYNGRDLAVVRAQRAGAVAVLGSATPSLESFRNAELGRYRSLLLPERATPRPLPPVELVDLRRFPPGPDGLLSSVLAEAVAANLAAGQQTILFLNRRGFSTFVLCRVCGNGVRCPHCAVSLTYHRERDRLVCHYCGYQQTVPTICPTPTCRQPKLERLGTGTERAEAVIRERFPGARVARLDRDTAGLRDHESGKSGLEQVLQGMNSGEIDILIGTQMVTKGHDFGGVTLVGVLQPDQSMDLPDFRATERVFQLLEQVAGRAGRGDRPGRVMIQTFRPEHPAIVSVTTHDYESFVRAEMETRRELGYPPFSRMVVLRLDAANESVVRADASAVASAVQASAGASVVIRGPAPAPIARIRGRSRFQVWVSSADRAPLSTAVRAASLVKLQPDVRMVIDVDPQSSL